MSSCVAAFYLALSSPIRVFFVKKMFESDILSVSCLTGEIAGLTFTGPTEKNFINVVYLKFQ